MTCASHLMQQTQDVVRLPRRQHRSRFIEDQDVALKVELLQDLHLLFLAGRKHTHLCRQIDLERHILDKVPQACVFRLPVDPHWQIGTCQQEIFCHRHSRHEREVLIHHADA